MQLLIITSRYSIAYSQGIIVLSKTLTDAGLFPTENQIWMMFCHPDLWVSDYAVSWIYHGTRKLLDAKYTVITSNY